jgi:hypothetical protein
MTRIMLALAVLCLSAAGQLPVGGGNNNGGGGGGTATDATLSTSDITTNNVSTSKHGFAPKAPNDATQYLDGTGNYSVPSVGGTIDPAVWASHNSVSNNEQKYFLSTGTSTAYVGCPTQAPGAYTTGMSLIWRPHTNGGGGATTVNVCTLGVKSIKTAANADPSSSDIVADGRTYAITYDGTAFRLPGSSGSGSNVLDVPVEVGTYQAGAVATGWNLPSTSAAQAASFVGTGTPAVIIPLLRFAATSTSAQKGLIIPCLVVDTSTGACTTHPSKLLVSVVTSTQTGAGTATFQLETALVSGAQDATFTDQSTQVATYSGASTRTSISWSVISLGASAANKTLLLYLANTAVTSAVVPDVSRVSLRFIQ